MSDIADKVDAWLEPLDDSSCGDDLEYDAEFMEMLKAAEGKPETQFSAAEPPEWGNVANLADGLLGRTRDVRVALLWGRAMLHSEGFSSLSHTLRMVHGWFDRYWDDVHPKPDADDGDLFIRMNTLAQFEDLDSFLGDVRKSAIVRSRAIGQLTMRDVEVALERIPPREDEDRKDVSSLEQMLTDAIAENEELRDVPQQAKTALDDLLSLLDEKAGYGQAPSCDTLKGMLTALVRIMPSDSSGDADSSDDFDSLLGDMSDLDGDDAAGSHRAARSGGGMGGASVETRADASRAIDLICDFLEKAEPTSPAQMLLRRAQKLLDKNFLELVRELAPDSLSEVAKLMGVDPDDIA